MNKTVLNIKTIIKRIPAYSVWQESVQENEYKKWISLGKPIPPPHRVKQHVIREYSNSNNIKTFVETGTYLGDMVEAVKNSFEQIYSIELDHFLFQLATKRFKGFAKIHLFQGDGGVVLKELLPSINNPCLFWLDGHYSSGLTARGETETSIEQELSHIFNHPLCHKHVILIDDARLFTGEGDYPSVLSLENKAKYAGFNLFTVKDDIIRIFQA